MRPFKTPEKAPTAISVFPKRWPLSLRKSLLTLLLLLAAVSWSLAQTGFQNVLSGAAEDEYCGSVKLGAGAYIVVGNTQSYSSNGATQILLSKYDAQGVLLWAKVISDPNDENTNYFSTDIQASCADSTWSPIDSQEVTGTPGLQPMTCVPTEQSDFYISGYKQSTAGGQISMVLIKTDNTGTVVWTRDGFTPNNSPYDEKGISVEVTSNWDIFIVGHAKTRGANFNDHVSVARFTRFGQLRWFKRYKINPRTSFIPYQSCPVEEMIQGSPIGIAVTGEYRDSVLATNPSAFVMRVGYYGNEYFRVAVPTRANLSTLGDGGNDIIIDSQANSNNFIVTGYTLDNNLASHTYLFQVSQTGLFVSGARLSLNDRGIPVECYGQSLVLGDPKAKVMIAGAYTEPFTGASNTYLLKSSYDGSPVYGRFFPSTTPNRPATESIAMYSDGDFIATNANGGGTGRDAIVILPTINNGMVNPNCQADTLEWDTVNIGVRSQLPMRRHTDTVRTWPTLGDVSIKPDTLRCFYEEPPQNGCCGQLASYQVDSCWNNWATGQRCYSIVFTVDTRDCPPGTNYMIWDPGTGGFVPSGSAITICMPMSGSSFVSVCVLVKYFGLGPPPIECQEFLCMDVYLPPCGILPGGGKMGRTDLGDDSHMDQTDELNIYPNPASLGSTAMLGYEFDKDMSVTIEVTDLSGRLIYSTFAQVHAGKGEIRLPIANLSAGTYLVNCTSEKLTKTIRLMIVR